MECNSTKFSKTCHGCKNKIPPEEACYSYDEFFWHNDADCFNCCVCKNSLIGKEFVPKDGNIYCSANCLNEGTAIWLMNDQANEGKLVLIGSFSTD